MPTIVLNFSELTTRGRWKVEFFLNGTQAVAASVFPSTPLREIVSERKETIDPQLYPTRMFSYLGLEHVEPHTGDLVDFAPKAGAEIKSRSKLFAPGDVLYGRLRPYLNKVYLAAEPVAEGICSGEFYVLTPNADVDPGFLRTLLASELVLSRVGACQTGAALPRLPLSELLSINIPIPPIEEQQAIGKFATAIDAQRKILSAQLERLPELLGSAFHGAIESGEPLPPLDF